MRFSDAIILALGAIRSHRLRSFLTALGIAIGIAAVVLLTSIGSGVQRFVLSEFTQFGSNLLGITPGRTTTAGMSGALISNVRPLTIDDAEDLKTLPHVYGAVPVVQGNAQVEFGKRTRRTYIFGVGPDVPIVWRIKVAIGRFLPDDPPQTARSFAVLGSKVRDELFGHQSPLGKRVRIGGERYRVVGVMESKGQLLGFDLDDAVYIPAGRALAMFDRESLIEIDLVFAAGVDPDKIAAAAKARLIARHGSEDFTIVTQEQMLKVLGSVLGMLTLAVGGLGGISLLVGAVGILTIMTIAVNERTAEIGLLRAIGANRAQILALFLGEAVALSSLGGLAGLILGLGGAWLLAFLVPDLPNHTPWTYVLYAECLAATIGLLAGVLPARHAAQLDPIEALRAE